VSSSHWTPTESMNVLDAKTSRLHHKYNMKGPRWQHKDYWLSTQLLQTRENMFFFWNTFSSLFLAFGKNTCGSPSAATIHSKPIGLEGVESPHRRSCCQEAGREDDSVLSGSTSSASHLMPMWMHCVNGEPETTDFSRQQKKVMATDSCNIVNKQTLAKTETTS
jgi:hypothetical protein